MPIRAVSKDVHPLSSGFVAIVAGESGTGKTSLVASLAYDKDGRFIHQIKDKGDKLYIKTPILFIDLEYGATGKALAWQPSKDLSPKQLWDMLMQIAKASARKPRPDGYVAIPLPDEDTVVYTRHVAWDTVDVLQRICYDTLPDYRDGRQKYGELLDRVGEWKSIIERSRIGQWLIAHVRIDQPITSQIEIAKLAHDKKNVTAVTAVRAVGGIGFQLFETGRLDLVGQMNRKIRERAALELYVIFDPGRGKPAMLTRPTMFNGTLFQAKDRFGIFDKSIVHFSFNGDGLVIPSPLTPVLEASAPEPSGSKPKQDKVEEKAEEPDEGEPEPKPEEEEDNTEASSEVTEKSSPKPSQLISSKVIKSARAAGLSSEQIEAKLSKSMKAAKRAYVDSGDIDEAVAAALAVMLLGFKPQEADPQESDTDETLDALWGEVEKELS